MFHKSNNRSYFVHCHGVQMCIPISWFRMTQCPFKVSQHCSETNQEIIVKMVSLISILFPVCQGSNRVHSRRQKSIADRRGPIPSGLKSNRISGQIISCFLVLQSTHALYLYELLSIDSETLVNDVIDSPVCVISIYYKTQCDSFVGVKSVFEDIVTVDS